MAPVRRRRSFRSGSPARQRRKRVWAREHAVITLALNTPSVVRPLADFRTEYGTNRGPVGATIAGGWIQMALQADPPPLAISRISVGLIVVDEDMTTQVPSPIDDMHVDWMWYQSFFMGAGEEIVHLDGTQQPLQAWRARRRMDEIGMDLFFAVEAGVAGTLQLNMSTLILLP